MADERESADARLETLCYEVWRAFGAPDIGAPLIDYIGPDLRAYAESECAALRERLSEVEKERDEAKRRREQHWQDANRLGDELAAMECATVAKCSGCGRGYTRISLDGVACLACGMPVRAALAGGRGEGAR